MSDVMVSAQSDVEKLCQANLVPDPHDSIGPAESTKGFSLSAGPKGVRVSRVTDQGIDS